jgi:preprotein translocase subunit SecY
MTAELARRIAFTLGALLIYRLGIGIPVPGVVVARSHLSFFSLGIFPYLSAAIVIQLLSMVSSRLTSLARSGEAGRRRIARVTLGLTLLFAALQAYGFASSLQRIPDVAGEAGALFVVSTTASMVGGTFFLIWLSELITLHGIGNGLAVVLSVGIVASIPRDVAVILELMRQGSISANLALLNAMFWVALVALIVFVEQAHRRVPVEFPGRTLGGRSLAAQSSWLPIKLNSAGLMVPGTVVPWLLSLPVLLAAAIFGDAPWLAAIAVPLQFGRPAHLILASLAIFVLALVYTSFVLDPEHAAQTLAKQGGVIPGVEPGEATAAYLDRAVSFSTLAGASYLTALSLVPEALFTASEILPLKISGGSALIVVCTILDIKTQMRGMSHT